MASGSSIYIMVCRICTVKGSKRWTRRESRFVNPKDGHRKWKEIDLRIRQKISKKVLDLIIITFS